MERTGIEPVTSGLQSAGGGWAEVVTDGRTGHLVAPSSPEAVRVRRSVLAQSLHNKRL